MNKLKKFCIVYQTGSITKASELLGITQPALSKAIKSLELEINKKLLLSSGRGIVVTDFGQMLGKKSLNMFSEIEKIALSDNQLSSNKVIKIATFELFSTYFMSELFSKEFPNSQCELNESTPGLIEQKVLNRECDIGITHLPIPDPGIDILKIKNIDMEVYGVKEKFKNLQLEDLQFCVPVNSSIQSPGEIRNLDGWPELTHKRTIKYKVELMESALQICSKGLAVGYFPSFVIDIYNRQRIKGLRLEKISYTTKKINTKQSVYLIKRKTDQENSYLKKIARMIRLNC